MKRSEKKLGDILKEKGLISEVQLDAALKEQFKTKEFLGAILLRKRLLKENDLAAVLSEQFGLAVVSLKDRYIDWNFVKEFGASLILDHRCFPVERDDWSVTIALANPLDAWAIKKAEEEARGLILKLVLATQSDLDEVIQRYQQFRRRSIRLE